MLCETFYDPSGGSNTAASGCNAPTTAVTGTSGSASAAGTTFALNETKNITGANDDGSDTLYVTGVTGERHLFRISSYTGGVGTCTAIVTVEAFDSTIASATWAVGGKRLHWWGDTSNMDMEDSTSGWTFTLGDEATYAYNDTSSVIMDSGNGTDGPIVVQCATGADVLITQAANGAIFYPWLAGTHALFRGDSQANRLTMQCIGADGVSKRAIYFNSNNITVTLNHVTLDGNSVGNVVSSGTTTTFMATDCDFMNARGTAPGVGWTGNRGSWALYGCRLLGNGGFGAQMSSVSTLSSSSFIGCVAAGNGDSGFYMVLNVVDRNRLIIGCTSDGNTNDGIEITGTPANRAGIMILNCLLTKNTRWGINNQNAGTIPSEQHIVEDYNCFWDNTTAEVNNITQGANDITLTADPYMDRTATPIPDLRLNATAGGGAAVRGVGLYAQTI